MSPLWWWLGVKWRQWKRTPNSVLVGKKTLFFENHRKIAAFVLGGFPLLLRYKHTLQMSPVWSADWVEVDVWLKVLDAFCAFLHLLCICRTLFFSLWHPLDAAPSSPSSQWCNTFYYHQITVVKSIKTLLDKIINFPNVSTANES